MSEFKPMIKMETTEPSVILKLKKGGHVNKKASSKAENGHTPMHKLDGGVMGALARTPALVGRPALNAPVAVPRRPSMAARRMAMMGKPPMAPQMPPQAMPTPMMKKGGKAKGHKEGGDIAQDKAMIKKAMKQHDMQEHKGDKGTHLTLKSGGKASGKAIDRFETSTTIEGDEGKFKNTEMEDGSKKDRKHGTGGVQEGKPGGYKDGGMATGGVSMSNAGGYRKGGKIQRKKNGGAMSSDHQYEFGNVTGTPPGKTNTKTGSVVMGKPGGFKKGGAPKKLADGGSVSSGRAVAMPEGNKKPTPPVAINMLSGTFKKGGHVKHRAEGGQMGREDRGEKSWRANEIAENRADVNAVDNFFPKVGRLIMRGVDALGNKLKGSPGAVTEKESSRTVVPAKKRGGRAR